MQIHKIMKEAVDQHKEKIELFQWAAISGASALIYSEYIRNIKQKVTPLKVTLVPEIRNVKDFLNQEGRFIWLLSTHLIDKMRENKLFRQFQNAPELILFTDEKIEILKTIFDLYIIPNIIRRIPETISMKFGLMNPKQQLIREDRDIVLFGRQPIYDDQFQFVVDQSVLQLLTLLPTIKKSIDIPEDHMKIHMTEKEILTVGNENAICPIYFDTSIIENKSIMELLKFVTSTNIKDFNNENVACLKNGSMVRYHVTTSPFNQVALTVLEEMNKETNSQDIV